MMLVMMMMMIMIMMTVSGGMRKPGLIYNILDTTTFVVKPTNVDFNIFLGKDQIVSPEEVAANKNDTGENSEKCSREC